MRVINSHGRCPVKKGVPKHLANFTVKHLCKSLFFIKMQAFSPATLIGRHSNTVFFCEICEIFKNSYFEAHLPTTASGEC